MSIEVLVAHRHLYTFVGPNGERLDEPRMVESDDLDSYPVGSTYVVWAGAPGTGKCVYRITRIDEAGAWGVVVTNTIRVMEPEEVE